MLRWASMSLLCKLYFQNEVKSVFRGADEVDWSLSGSVDSNASLRLKKSHQLP